MKFVVFLGLVLLTLPVVSGCTPVGVVIGGVAAAGVTLAEERSVEHAVEDANIKVKILNAFIQESESLFVDVSTTVIEGRVLVTGEVQSDNDRDIAGSLIWSIVGVKTVLNELQVSDKGTFGSSASDTWISTKLKTRLLQDLDVKHVNYSIDTVNKIVYLMGIAQDQDEIERVYLHARDISGVRKVVSHMVLKDSR
ncbi:MAG: BON domain-containing protein [Sneathiella sp.]|nr:BON domain-containing protein [Sneathiella sp.]